MAGLHTRPTRALPSHQIRQPRTTSCGQRAGQSRFCPQARASSVLETRPGKQQQLASRVPRALRSPDLWGARLGSAFRGCRRAGPRRAARVGAQGASSDDPTAAIEGNTGAGEESPSAPLEDTLSALDAMLGLDPREAERARAEEEAEEEQAAEARRFDQSAAFAADAKRLERQRLIRNVVSPSYRVDEALSDFVRRPELVDPLKPGRTNRGPGKDTEGEFTLPCIMQSRPLSPGLVDSFNLYEPRWLTLFAALLGENQPRILRNKEGQVRVVLDEDARFAAYEEAGEEVKQGALASIRPGRGRLPEAAWRGSRRFGVACREPDQAGGGVGVVGCVMEVTSTDVTTMAMTGGLPVLVVYARAVERFEVREVLQCSPYLVVRAAVLPQPAASPASEQTRSIVMSALAAAFNDPSVPGSKFKGTFVPRYSQLLEPLSAPEIAQVSREAEALPAPALTCLVLGRRQRAIQRLLQADPASTNDLALRLVQIALNIDEGSPGYIFSKYRRVILGTIILLVIYVLSL